MKTVPKIDIHVHVSTFGGRELPRFDGDTLATPEQIRKKYSEWGIERGVALPEINNECGFMVQSNESVMTVADENPDLFWWFCNLSSRMGNNDATTDFSYFIEFYKARGAKGVGELMTNIPFDDPRNDNLFSHCESCGMPVIFHIATQKGGMYGLIDDPGLPRLERMLKKHPNLTFIGHSQPFWAEMDSRLDPRDRNGYPTGPADGGRIACLMREYGNLYGDMSAGSGGNAFMRDEKHAFRFIDEFQNRLLFGTDICAERNYMKLSHWIDEHMLSGDISETAYRKLSRENALSVLKI